MDAAVVELDPLTDPVGASAQDDHLFPVRNLAFVLDFVCGVIIGGVGREFRRAGVHQLVGGRDIASDFRLARTCVFGATRADRPG